MPKEKRSLPAEDASSAKKKKKKSPQMVTVSPGAASASTSPAAAAAVPSTSPAASNPQLSAASALAEPVASISMPSKKPALIVVLERACLETGKVGKEHVLLNCDDHANFLRKHKRDPADSRPDILHQCMLILLDSPLNKAGLLRLYVKSEKGVLIEVSPSIRIPRTFKRFSGLMTQLLFKLSIRASNGPTKLLKVIKNPVTDHLPPNAKIHLLSVTGDLTSMPEWVPKNCPKDAKGALKDPVVFVAGAMAHGKVEPEYDVDSCLAISEYPLSGAAALGRLTAAFENHLGVL